jgi:hypothetical protein
MKTWILCLLLAASTVAFAQSSDSPRANITEDMQIVLPAADELASVYLLDISDLAFDSAEKAKQFFGMFTENVVHYVVDFDAKQVEIHLHSYADPAWDLAKWNSYFQERSVKMQAVYNTL